MGFWSKTPANELGGFKNVWDFTGYGLWQVWVMTGSTVLGKDHTKKIHHGLWINFTTFIFHIWHCNLVFCDYMRLCSHLPAWFRLIMTDNQRFTKCGLDPFGLLLVQGGGSGMPRDLPVGAPCFYPFFGSILSKGRFLSAQKIRLATGNFFFPASRGIFWSYGTNTYNVSM